MELKSAGGNTSNNVEEGANSISVDESRSSSASSASVVSATSAELSSEDLGDIDRNEHGNFAHDHEKSEKALPKQGPSSSTLESPQVQLMEHPPGSSGCRNSPHVSAASKPGTLHREWSLASNDSLFSIHNMSFTREQFNMLLKSGELGMYGDMLKSGELGRIADICKSGELPPPLKDALRSLKEQLPAVLPDLHKSGEQLTATAGTDTEIKKDDPTSNVIKREGAELSLDQLPCVAVSRDTEAFAPSFAYQVVAKSERDSSVRSTRSEAEKAKETDTSDSGQGEQLKENSETPAEASSSSFSYFSCCSCWGGCGNTTVATH
uniref:Uncharacterized protein n=1 Tax=Opuntia streptacantha TaxID=393608 RepID=A0A7C8YHV4_OPUST